MLYCSHYHRWLDGIDQKQKKTRRVEQRGEIPTNVQSMGESEAASQALLLSRYIEHDVRISDVLMSLGLLQVCCRIKRSFM